MSGESLSVGLGFPESWGSRDREAGGKEEGETAVAVGQAVRVVDEGLGQSCFSNTTTLLRIGVLSAFLLPSLLCWPRSSFLPGT